MRDVVRALEAIVGVDVAPFEIVNVGTGVGTTVRTIAEEVARVWDEASSSSTKTQFTGQTRAGDPFSLVALPTRLDALGFRWSLSIAETLHDYVRWYRAETRVETL